MRANAIHAAVPPAVVRINGVATRTVLPDCSRVRPRNHVAREEPALAEQQILPDHKPNRDSIKIGASDGAG